MRRSLLVSMCVLLPLGCGEVETTIGIWDDSSPSSGGAGGVPLSASGGEGGSSALPLLGASFEAEDGVLSGPFAIASSPSGDEVFVFATEASQEPADPGLARALYRFELEEAGDYLIYGRIHSPSALENRFYFRVDEGPWTLWRISTGDEWFWDDLHDDTDFGTPMVFSLSAGIHEFELANAVLGAEIDRFQVLPIDSPAPRESVVCDPPHAILLSGECVRSCGSYGNVTCIEEDCVGREEVAVYDCAICCLVD